MYVSLEDVRATANQVTSSTLPDDQLTKLVLRASRIFDLACGVSPEYFESAGDTATAKTIYGDGTNYLKLPPYVGSLTITMPTGYTVPEYVVQNGYLILSSNGTVPAPLQNGYGWLKVAHTITARWGYSETPLDVQHAVIELAINLLRETDPASVKLVNLDGLALREGLPPRVKEVARRYRMKQAFVA